MAMVVLVCLVLLVVTTVIHYEVLRGLAPVSRQCAADGRCIAELVAQGIAQRREDAIGPVVHLVDFLAQHRGGAGVVDGHLRL